MAMPGTRGASAALCLCALLGVAAVLQSMPRRAALDQVAENAVAEEAAEGAQFPPEQGLMSGSAPKKILPFTFKPGQQEGKHWWWARPPRRQALARASAPGAVKTGKEQLVSAVSPKVSPKRVPTSFTFKLGRQEGKHWWWARPPRRQALARASAPGAGTSSKGKECLELAKRARSSGLKPGDRKLAQVCLKLAKGDEKASRQHVDKEIKAKVQKKEHFNEKKELGLMVGSKEVTLHLYRPKGFHEVALSMPPSK